MAESPRIPRGFRLERPPIPEMDARPSNYEDVPILSDDSAGGRERGVSRRSQQRSASISRSSGLQVDVTYHQPICLACNDSVKLTGKVVLL